MALCHFSTQEGTKSSAIVEAMSNRRSKRLLSLLLATTFVCFLFNSASQRQKLVEYGRLFVDKLTCDPVYHAVPIENVPIRTLSGKEDCHPVVPRPFHRLPAVYVADREVMPPFADSGCLRCLETDFLDILKSNATGNLVDKPSPETYVFVPFPATCKECQKPPVDQFPRALSAVSHLPGRRFTINRRPFPERTNVARPLRQLLLDFPEVTCVSLHLSPSLFAQQSCPIQLTPRCR